MTKAYIFWQFSILSMNWKQFLKPNWKKIVLTIILILFMPIMTDYIFVDCAFGSQECPGGGPKFGNLFSEITKQISGQYNIFYDETTFRNFTSWFLSQSLIIGNIIISYFLSCFIVWIYDKARKKK